MRVVTLERRVHELNLVVHLMCAKELEQDPEVPRAALTVYSVRSNQIENKIQNFKSYIIELVPRDLFRDVVLRNDIAQINFFLLRTILIEFQSWSSFDEWSL